MSGKRELQKEKKPGILKTLGFTNCLAIILVLLLVAGLAGGFFLAYMSIRYQYMGALACYTVVFTPIGTALSLVLNKIVVKSTIENTGADGEGIKYAAAKANNFLQNCTGSVNSPGI